jgi:predicted metal-dependent HD superfamily phosphohydrolase
MFSPVATKDPTAVEVEVQAAYRAMFPGGQPLFVPRVFGWAIECFTGAYGDYQAVDAHYHDFEHTLQGTLCMARLLHGRHLAKADPQISQPLFQLGLVAILLHDTGYLKKKDDTTGTGAKYTITHVQRSADFAARLLAEKGLGSADIQAVRNMICCTGVDAVLSVIHFQSEMERIVSQALGTADLLGQMAAEDYLEKLPTLYAEFEEATRFTGDKRHFVATYSSAADLMQKTPQFWKEYVRLKLNRDFGGLYRFLNDPYPFGPNYYLERIEANMERLRLRAAVAKA